MKAETVFSLTFDASVTIIVDSQTSTPGVRSLVGSSSLHPRSEKLSSETAVVFLEPELAQPLSRRLLDDDLRLGREVSLERAAGCEPPFSVIERFRKPLGGAFEDQL